MRDGKGPVFKAAGASALIAIAEMLGLAFALSMGIFSSALAADLKGSADHPLVGRFHGSSIVGYQKTGYGEYLLPLGPTENRGSGGSNNWVLSKSQNIEGNVTRILYDMPPPHSSLEVFRNYQQALAAAGFKTLYECSYKDEPRVKGGCGWAFFGTPPFSQNLRDFEYDEASDVHYLAAHLKNDKGEAFISLAVFVSSSSVHSGHVWVEQDIIEKTALNTGQVVANAEALGKGIAEEGHAVVPGIYFDTGLATIKPESKPSLDELAKFLKSKPKMKVFVVGHTDNQGGLKFNLTLSDKRAKAVEEALVTGYSIDRKRLSTAGLGYLAPIASNDTEKGRAKNRRVELVEQ